MGLFDKLMKGMAKTRTGIAGRIDGLLSSFHRIDEELFEELEEILIASDAGIHTTQHLIDNLKEEVKEKGLSDPLMIKDLLKQHMISILEGNSSLNIKTTPSVIVVLGVNGVGKTTSIGKLAYMLKTRNKKVIMAASDTFRAAAAEQLEVWSKRAGADIVMNKEGSDPASVVFDAIQAARSRKADVLICDTAGRLHTKKNLMEELAKILRIIRRELPDSSIETLLVLDATTGQNALSQVEMFNKTAGISGIIMTKLDGTAKGGILFAVKHRLNIPIKFIGIGEGIEDFLEFKPVSFVEAVLRQEV